MRKKFQDITGKRFGKIVVLDCNLPERKTLIRCDCGKEKIVSRYDVANGKIKSCGKKGCRDLGEDLTSLRFGILTIVKRIFDKEDMNGRCKQWECLCDCGNTCVVGTSDLLRSHTKSCGCIKSENISKANSLPIKDVAEKQLFTSYKRSAVKRNLEWKLSKNEFVSFLQQECFYCGSPPIGTIIKNKVIGNEEYHFNGIDRVDNSIGYITDNCVACCKHCNHAKKALSKEEFISLAKKIARRFV